MLEVFIRSAVAEDMASVTGIYGRSVQTEFASFELEPPSAEEMTQRWSALINDGYPYLVALINDEVVGYAYASAYRPRPAYNATVENTVYVNHSYQRQGIAKSLMNELIYACKKKAFRQMVGVIACAPDRPEPHSVLLHKSLGFEQVGQLTSVGFKQNQWLDVVLMQRALD